MINTIRYRHIILVILLSFIVIGVSVAQRIVSLAPSITKNIYLLQAADKLVGCTSYCEMAVNDNKDIVGSAISVNLEKVITLNPDIVMAAGITDPQTTETFKKFGIKVVVYPSAKSFEGICSQLKDLGRLIDREEIADSIVVSAHGKLETIKGKVPKNAHLKMFFQIGSNPIFTVLTNTFMNDFILMAGGENICKEMTRGTVSRELVVLRNPDVIIVSDMGKIGYEEKKVWESFEDMSAVKKDNVFVVDSDKSCSPTITDFIEILEYIISKINY